MVFDVSYFDYGDPKPNYLGYTWYRAYQIPDIYSHSAGPVTDLVVLDKNQTPVLEFSADPTHNYLIQASTDLTNWTTIGSAVQDGNAGDFGFQDLSASQFEARFYRVVTQ